MLEPEVGDIWLFEPTGRHYLILTTEKPPAQYNNYHWFMKTICLERDVTVDTIYGGTSSDPYWRKVT
jgi:hypothetical protein